MFKSILRDKWLLVLVLLTIGIHLFSTNEAWVERYYTYGFYPYISRLLRLLFGWVPFSIGDLLYIFAFIYLVSKTWKFLTVLRKRVLKEYLSWVLLRKLLRLVLWIYVVFNVFWGINYSRLGIASQLQLNVQAYTPADLDTLTTTLISKLNATAVYVNQNERAKLGHNKTLFREAVLAYKEIKNQMPFLTYHNPSIKPSMFSHIGHYFGFTGYYNPFSGEAQIKTTAPIFIKPFVSAHEIAHQLGYAKENEANFASFFACRSSRNTEFRYSVYYDMYYYAIAEIKRSDTIRFNNYRKTLHPQVLRDDEELMNYLRSSANALEPVISAFYDQYLKANNQPQGKRTYNQVVAWLIAYGKKYGWNAL